ncbi:MAG: transcription antitermination factor NusB [Chitinophagales bacterium]|nr:transcription antitermination factor NusB [Chitinophagales bacterium]MCZ2394042.1 transcription antitermination factor NusB [Chitinophagales bacterium]
MISRRSVRVKVMQAVYGYERSDDALPAAFRKSLQANIHSVKDLYLYLLLSIRDVANEVDTVSKIKASKHLPTQEDKNFSTKLLSNVFILNLNNDEEFLKALKKSDAPQNLDEAVKNHLYKLMVEAPEYIEYISSDTEFDLEEDRKIISAILNNILLSNDLFLEHIEEIFPSWEDDAEFVVGAVREVFKKSKESLKLHIGKNSVKGKILELSEFADKLFEKVIQSKEELTIDIEPYLKNWDLERIAVIDLIIMRMALTEFTDFPSIPLKVTMNEYIDIAKDYSSPKSKDFINGILDRMMKDMNNKGLIGKTGRGLNDK